MKDRKKLIGQMGERIASKYLSAKGYRILERNFFSRYGEIDIIALDGKELVFVEVKTRRNEDYGYASQAVTPKKRYNLIRTSRKYMAMSRVEGSAYRYDVVECYWETQTIRHICNAF